MGLPLLLGHRLRIDIHGRADIRMSQELLLDLQVFSIGPKKGREGMAESMPAYFPEGSFPRSRLDPPLLDALTSGGTSAQASLSRSRQGSIEITY